MAEEKVALDTSVFIYYFEGRSRHAARCRQILTQVEQGGVEAVTSTMCALETLVRPLFLHEEATVLRYEEWFRQYPHLEVRAVDLAVAILAAELVAAERMSVPDAIVGATALESGCSRLITNDGDFRVLEDRGLRIELLGAPA